MLKTISSSPACFRRAALMAMLLLLPAITGCDRSEKRPPVTAADTTAPATPADTTVAASTAADSSMAISIIDAVGEKVELARPARRVISLAPNLTEMIFALGGGDQLVGRTSYCDYPAEATKVPAVGDMLTLRYEDIIALKPDLIVMSIVGNTDANYRKLRDLGLTVCAIGAENVGHVIASIDTMGMLLGRRAEASVMIERLFGQIDSIRGLAVSAPPVSAFIVIDKSPLITASRGFFAEELMLAGGENIAAGESATYPKYSREAMLRRNPEVILLPGTSWSSVEDLLKTYPEWKNLRAVRGNRVYVIPPDILLRPGPRITQGLAALYEALHGADPKALLARLTPAAR